MSLEDIYSMHPEYGEYDESKFGDRLNGIITIVKKMENRAEEDYEALRRIQRTTQFRTQIGKDIFSGKDLSRDVLL